MRRGKLVEIPAEWLGKVTGHQKINKRPSKALHKMRKYIKYASTRTPTKQKSAAVDEAEQRSEA